MHPRTDGGICKIGFYVGKHGVTPINMAATIQHQQKESVANITRTRPVVSCCIVTTILVSSNAGGKCENHHVVKESRNSIVCSLLEDDFVVCLYLCDLAHVWTRLPTSSLDCRDSECWVTTRVRPWSSMTCSWLPSAASAIIGEDTSVVSIGFLSLDLTRCRRRRACVYS